MQYKLLALDIDGTVTDSHKQITPRTRETLLRAQRLGVKVVLASGRPAHGVFPLAEELELSRFGGYVLAFNGAKIVGCRTGGTVFEQTVAPGWVRPLCRAARESGLHLLTYTADGGHILTGHPDDPYVALESRINRLPLRQVEDIACAVNHPVNKFLMTGEPEQVAAALPVVRAVVGEELNVFRSEPFFLEVMPNGVDKAHGLEHLLETLGFAREELLACGDGYNDISMLRFAGLGVAMENAQDAAKQASDYVTRSNDEDGVACAVDRFVLQCAADAL